jgi:hypothetical protein
MSKYYSNLPTQGEESYYTFGKRSHYLPTIVDQKDLILTNYNSVGLNFQSLLENKIKEIRKMNNRKVTTKTLILKNNQKLIAKSENMQAEVLNNQRPIFQNQSNKQIIFSQLKQEMESDVSSSMDILDDKTVSRIEGLKNSPTKMYNGVMEDKILAHIPDIELKLPKQAELRPLSRPMTGKNNSQINSMNVTINKFHHKPSEFQNFHKTKTMNTQVKELGNPKCPVTNIKFNMILKNKNVKMPSTFLSSTRNTKKDGNKIKEQFLKSLNIINKNRVQSALKKLPSKEERKIKNINNEMNFIGNYQVR